MAIVDGDRDEIVIRILYDGPPLAGKTTSLKALHQVLAARRRSDLFTPGEIDGRTIYFDWMDYLGGWFEGQQVRCQMVSAPGQRSLVERRKLLLRDADVVVFVCESTPTGMEAAQSHYAELRALLGDADPRIPVVMQANKQDLPEALGIDEIRDRFASQSGLAIFESSASGGRGVREAFTFAVRLALDRVRELSKKNLLRVGEPRARDGASLLEWMEREEAESDDTAPIEGDWPTAVRDEAPASFHRIAGVSEGPPALPNSRAASGLVWPPMEGRIVLLELEGDAEVPTLDARGAWWSQVPGRWTLESDGEQVYDDVEVGRRALLEVARLHARLGTLLSPRRALVLADSGPRLWRLWRIARVEPCLHDALERSLDGGSSGRNVGARLCEIAEVLLRGAELFRRTDPQLPVSLRDLGAHERGPCLVGILPARIEAGRSHEAAPADLIRRELGPPVTRAVREGRVDARRALAQLRDLLRANPERLEVIEALGALLIGS